MKTDRCPSKTALEAFAHGKTSDDQIDAISSHLEECGDCNFVLDRLERQSNELLGHLRESLPLEMVKGDSEVQNLIDDVRHSETQFEQSKPPHESSPDLPIGTMLAGYRIEQELGRGGMGTVYKAEHVELEKTVAIKFLRTERSATTGAEKRFERERKLVAKLRHDNIVQAHDAGEVDGRPYLVMEFVEGTDLARLVDDNGPLPVEQACVFLRQAAQGLAHAHDNGIIHRDLKPSNLLISNDGRVMLTDLGLARFHSETPSDETGLTQEQQIMGTPDYMAPEQGLDTREAGVASDLYSLGCTLYFLLTGQPPFAGDDFATLGKKLRAHQQTPPLPVSRFRNDVPKSLVALLDKLLAKNPDDRPDSASEVADELTRVLTPAPQPEPSNRTPRLLMWTALAVCVAAVTFAVSLWKPKTIQVENETGTLVLNVDDENIEVTIRKGKAIIVDGKTNRRYELEAGEYEIKVVCKDGKNSDLTFETKRLVISRGDKLALDVRWQKSDSGPHPTAGRLGVNSLVTSPAELRGLLGWDIVPKNHTGDVKIAVSPDSKWLATGSDGGVIRFYAIGKEWTMEKAFVTNCNRISHLVWSWDSKRIAVVGQTTHPEKTTVWEVATGFKVLSLKEDGEPSWSRDGGTLALWKLINEQEQIFRTTFFDISSGRIVDQATIGASLRYLADGKTLATVQHNRLVFRNATTLEKRRSVPLRIKLPAISVSRGRTVLWSPDETCVAIEWHDSLIVLETRTGNLLSEQVKKEWKTPNWRICWKPNSRQLLMGGLRHEWPILSFDVWTGRVETLVERFGYCSGIQFISRSDQLAVVQFVPGSRSRIRAFSSEPTNPPITIEPSGSSKSTSYLSWVGKDNRLFAAQAGTWEMNELIPLSNPREIGLGGILQGGGWSPDGRKHIALEKGGFTVYKGQEVVAQLDPIPKSATSHSNWKPVWMADNRHFAILSAEKKLYLWDTENGKRVREWDSIFTWFEPHVRIAISPDTKWLVGGLNCQGDELHIYDLEGTKLDLYRTVKMKNTASSLSFSPSGSQLAVAVAPNILNIVNTKSWKIESRFEDHSFQCSTQSGLVEWSPQAEYLATIGSHHQLNYGVIRIRRPRTGDPLRTLLCLDVGRGISEDRSAAPPRGIALTPKGHYRGTPERAVRREIRYVIQTKTGQQTLPPDEFEKRFGWKNDPSRVTFGKAR